MNEAARGLDPGPFLQRYWQREPLLIRQAWPDFKPDIDADDLAGLACEPLAEARLISGPDAGGGWQLRHGPFAEDDFLKLGERNWTLLVQDVEKHYPPLAQLLERFSFLPRWRLDDIMISFAAPGGSVGPHVDQYDVFLLQAAGSRRWEISRDFDPQRRNDVPLDMLEHFSPQQQWVLEPGDMLYLPPGIAHHGVALDPCLTYSIGLRAPSNADLLLALGEHYAAQPGEGGRYRDPPLSPGPVAGLVDTAALEQFRRLLQDALERRDELVQLVGAFLSRYRLAHEPLAEPGGPGPEQLLADLEAGAAGIRHPWTRLNWVRRDDQAMLFAAGQEVRCSPPLAERLCGPQPFLLAPLPLSVGDREAVLALLQSGHLLLAA